MTIVAVDLLVGAVIIVLVALLARLTWATHRRERPASISEAQARENAAPLSTAIVASDQHERAAS